MFGSIGGPELLLILVIALLVFGPRRIPELSRTIGRGLAEFRRATNDFKSTLEREVSAADLKIEDPPERPSTTPPQDGKSEEPTDAPPGSIPKTPSENG
jgi:Tat protein translocase TatB subunit